MAARLTARFEVEATEERVVALDEWCRRQPDLPSRPEGIRRSVEQAVAASLRSTGKDTPSRAERRAHASKLAGEAIDRSLSHSGHSEEAKASRKKRLTKLPRELRKEG